MFLSNIDYIVLSTGVPALIVLMVTIYNYFTAPRYSNTDILSNNDDIKFSVLIPARNEERNIAECLHSVLEQSFPPFEILILNDGSTDGTLIEIEKVNTGRSKVKVLNGAALPEGWKGKNWACHQLAENSRGSYLLFLDADVRLGKNALAETAGLLRRFHPAMLSVFPTQITKTLGESLIVPLMNWLLLSFLPLRLVYSSERKSFIAANGQMIVLHREVYIKFGGHKMVKDKVVEDMEIARMIKGDGGKVLTLLGGKGVFCRMYNGFNEAIAGFTKNFYPGFNISRPVFFLMLIFFLLVFFIPFLLIPFSHIAVITSGMILLSRILIALISGQNPLLQVVFHPLQMMAVFWVGINSAGIIKQKKVIWKGRTL